MDIKLLVSDQFRMTPKPTDMILHPAGYIDFSFGNPSPETFPLDEIIIAANNSLGKEDLQYCADRGAEQLLFSLSKWLYNQHGCSIKAENLVITNGSMDGIALIAETFINQRDVILTESPTYWKARDIFENAGAKVVYIPFEPDGIKVDILESRIEENSKAGRRCKLLYIIPNHQNPTGYVTSLEKRKQILSICHKHNILIIEDDVYSHLTYDGHLPPSMFSLSDKRSVIQVGSLSKLISPGIRIGWIIGSETACDFMLKAKKDGGTNPLASQIASYLLDNLDWDKRLSYLRSFYSNRLGSLLSGLKKISSDFCTWEKPSGGFYFWLRMGHSIPLNQFEMNCEKLGVGFMPGYLCTNDDNIGHDHIRLAFSNLEPEQIQIGTERLYEAFFQTKE